ncbi:MAG: hypothetical protein K2G96_05325 [Clostridia bacterium]|nr:hypothetical protein [Clostridia bacterium]
MKRFFKIATAALAIGMAATLAGCGGFTSCSSCSSCNSNAKNTTLTNSNWFPGTSYKGIQPSFIDNENAKEILNYTVTYNGDGANNTSYSVDYTDGSYKTTFYATKINRTTLSFPEGYTAPDNKDETVYCFETDFKISVKYKLKSGTESDWLDDSITTKCYFRAAGNNLQPVYSERSCVTHVPVNASAGSLESAYKEFSVSYINYYTYDCAYVTTVTQENGEEQTDVRRLKTNNSLFDNEELYIAVRSMKNSSGSQTVSVYIPADGGLVDRSINASSAGLGDEDRKNVTAVLTENGLYKPSGEDDAGVTTVAADIARTDGRGVTQTVWYAAITDADNNVSRSTMLKMTMPLSYGLGTLNFVLSKVGE